MKNFLLIFTLAFLVSCGKSSTQNQQSDINAIVPYNEPMIATEDGGVPNEALTFQIHLVLDSFDAAQETKINTASDLVKKVIASQEFKDAVLNFTYNGQKQFANNKGWSNLQIYNHILLGAETMNGIENNAMDVEVELYYEDSTTIGYTYPETTHIWMNHKYFDTYTPVQVSDNLTHEWLHKLGFEHDAARTPARPYSVPYGVGYIVERLAQKYASP